MSPARSSQRGSAAVELTVIVPALVIMLGMMIAGGRLWFARTTVTEAADSAARAASLSRDAGQAAISARSAGQQVMTTGGLECSNQAVSVDTAAFSVPVGTPATVRTTVSCTVHFTDILLPGMPGSITLQVNGRSALDTYRSR